MFYKTAAQNMNKKHVKLAVCNVVTIKNTVIIRSNNMQQYAGIYLLQYYSTCFGCPSHQSSGVHKTVTAASGIRHIT
jgi:hypothetical protein